jgi:hypothetical protein
MIGMPAEKLFAYDAAMPRLQAADMLEQARRGEISLNADSWFDLTLMVTGDRDAAEKAHNDYVKREMKAGRTPQ